MILSASRRTDIPAYYSEWLLKRLQEGYAYTRNPMNHSQVSRISLSVQVIDCIVFWTKDPLPMMDKLTRLDEMGYRYYFQFTLTPYGKDIERNLRDKEEILKTFCQLSDKIGKDKVLWRYDPIILNDAMDMEYHRKCFESLCSRLKGYTNVCTISFVDLYSRLINSVKDRLIKEITVPEMYGLAKDFSEIGSSCGIELRACSEKVDLTGYGIKPASCIDKATVEKACGYRISSKPDTNQRAGCGCIQSVDIGIYNTCQNGCIYCYANHSPASIESNCAKHAPDSEILIGRIGSEDKITEREMKSLREDQVSFFL